MRISRDLAVVLALFGVLIAFTAETQFKFEPGFLSGLALRVLELAELYERSSGTVVLDEKDHINLPFGVVPQTAYSIP